MRRIRKSTRDVSLTVEEINLILKTQSSFIKQRDNNESKNYQLTQLTKADINLLKLVEAAQKDLNNKTIILDKINYMVANESKGVQRFVENFKQHNMSDNFNQEKKLIDFRNVLKNTKQIVSSMDNEETRRIQRIIENTESIKKTYERIQQIVYQQGQVIDRIDYNIMVGEYYIGKANKELEMLFESYNKTAFGCQICLMVTIVILSVIIFIKLL